MSDFLKNYDAITDTQLRSCVKLLGKLLGNAISAHAGKEVYTVVEKLRKGFINLQENKDQKNKDQKISRKVFFIFFLLGDFSVAKFFVFS